ncbi:MAG: hypothetical protein IBJ19_04605 [Gemmatimonadaceae bacterium]|nr:hypothetical protein [Gemmatimonadaceae bacterium]
MKYCGRLAALFALLLLPIMQMAAQATRHLGDGLVLAMPISADAANDGAAVVADFTGSAVHYLGPDGKRRWSLTAKGSGPGDVLRPYRVTLGDNTVWVYDYSARDVSVFTRAGKFVRRFRPSIALTMVDDIAALGDTLLAMLGTTRHTGFENHAIHIFDAGGQHLRSFGEIAFTVDRSRLSTSGTGTLARTLQNSLLYVRKGPFELLDYAADGTLLQKITPPVKIVAVVDSLTRVVTNSEGREQITSRAAEIQYPVRAVPLSNGSVLSGISDRGTMKWWIHARSSAPVPVTIPRGMSPTTWNSRTCELLVLTEIEDEPALVALDVRAVFPQPNINSLGCKR